MPQRWRWVNADRCGGTTVRPDYNRHLVKNTPYRDLALIAAQLPSRKRSARGRSW